jgi:hypothetical protein
MNTEDDVPVFVWGKLILSLGIPVIPPGLDVRTSRIQSWSVNVPVLQG